MQTVFLVVKLIKNRIWKKRNPLKKSWGELHILSIYVFPIRKPICLVIKIGMVLILLLTKDQGQSVILKFSEPGLCPELLWGGSSWRGYLMPLSFLSSMRKTIIYIILWSRNGWPHSWARTSESINSKRCRSECDSDRLRCVLVAMCIIV